MREEIQFDGRVVVVTGAGGGLGRAHAHELARRGARVVVNDVGGDVRGTGASRAADVVVAEIEELGGLAVANHDSVADPAGGEAIVRTAVDAFGTVDAVVNNAGILRDRSFANLEWDELEAVLDVHLRGAFHVSRPAFRIMKDKGYGRFVFTSSNSGLLGNFGQSNYAAAKMGLVGLSNVLAIEGARYGILSNVIAPTALTRMTEGLGSLIGPLADAIDPAQVSPMVAFLCSEENTHTHEIFTAGGGRFARYVVGVNDGWFAGAGTIPSAEQVRDHLDEIRDVSDLHVYGSITEELQLLVGMLS